MRQEEQRKRNEEISLINETLRVVQEGYVKPDANTKGNNATGVVRDAKFARPLYKALLDKLAILYDVEKEVETEKEIERQYGRDQNYR